MSGFSKSPFGASESLLASFPGVEEIFVDLQDDNLSEDLGGEDQDDDLSPFAGNVPFVPPQVASLFSQEMIDGPYDLWEMQTTLRWFEGIGMMPVAAPPSGVGGQNGIGVLPTAGDLARQAAQIVRLSAPYGIMGVYWMARRTRYQPTLPMPIVNSNAVFCECELSFKPPKVLSDNTKIWTIAGLYLFFLKKPVWLLDGLNPGKSPADTLQPSDNIIPQAVFRPLF